MPGDPIRVISDIHFGDRSSRVVDLGALRPIAEGVGTLVLNGDTLDTRPGPAPERTAECRERVASFFASLGIPVSYLTGNHDPDISEAHWLDLADGRGWAIHGDVLFEDVVPWGADGPAIRRRVRAALAARGGRPEQLPLAERFALLRPITAAVRQRHQSETRPVPYVMRLLRDILWPPWRLPRMFAAWRTAPKKARQFAARYRPKSRFTLIGHTHRPGLWRAPDGGLVVNTGSFARPFSCWAADILGDVLRIREIRQGGGVFRAGPVVAEFSL